MCVVDVYCRYVDNDQAAEDVYRIMVQIADHLGQFKGLNKRDGHGKDKRRLATRKATGSSKSASHPRQGGASASASGVARNSAGASALPQGSDNRGQQRTTTALCVTAGDVKALHDTHLFTDVTLMHPSQHSVDPKVGACHCCCVLLLCAATVCCCYCVL